MKKICLLTMGLALMTVTAFAAPQTDIQQGKTAVDLISGEEDKKYLLQLHL